MTFTSILVHAEADAAAEARLGLAAKLANRFGASLIGVAAEIFDRSEFTASLTNVDGELLVAEAKAIEADLTLAEKRFRAAAAAVKAGAHWRSDVAMPHEMIALHARAADLVVVGPRRRQPIGFHNRADPGDVLMSAGRPILIAPLEDSDVDTSGVLVAWKDAREARRAVVDALPFLKAAERVAVAEVCTEAEAGDVAERLADVVALLGRHGVKAKAVVQTPAGKTSVADTLLDIAEMEDAGLIVAGGFGHARLREWVFGGVTQDLLDYGKKPVLLSH